MQQKHVLNISFDWFDRSSAISNELAARGHNVTILSADREKIPPKNVHYIHIEGLYGDLYHETMNGFFTFRKNLNPLTASNKLNEFWFEICKSKYEETEKAISKFQ